MQKLRILESGFSKLTGVAGGIEFENGLSVEPVSKAQAARLSAAMRCEFENGSNPSPAGVLKEESNTPAPILEKMEVAAPPREPTGVEKYIAAQAKTQPAKQAPKYTKESLEDIADKKGIAGLRLVADEFGVKSNSIAGLIAAIEKAQG